MPSVKANRFNVKRIVYAVISKDDKTAFTHGTIKDFAVPMQVQLTPTLATGQYYGGGAKTEDESRITGYELQLEVNKIFPEVRAEIFGHTYENGRVIVKTSDQPKDIAIGYEVDETGGHRELVWFYKGKARPFAQTVQQTTNSINYSSDTVTIGCMPREHDEKIMEFGDTANSDFSEEDAEAFLDEIPGGTPDPETSPEPDPAPEG